MARCSPIAVAKVGALKAANQLAAATIPNAATEAAMARPRHRRELLRYRRAGEREMQEDDRKSLILKEPSARELSENALLVAAVLPLRDASVSALAAASSRVWLCHITTL